VDGGRRPRCNLTKVDRRTAVAAARSWVSSFPEREAWLDKEFGEAARPLDLSRESLERLEPLASQRLAWRPSGAGLEEVDRPIWFESDTDFGYERFSDETLWLLDALMLYLGQAVLQKAPEEWEWNAGNHRAKGYIFQNLPVLKRGKLRERCPVVGLINWATLHLEGRPGSSNLPSIYDAYLA
jgi:hypothetical protein